MDTIIMTIEYTGFKEQMQVAEKIKEDSQKKEK